MVKFCVKFICQFLFCEKIYIVLSLSISTKTLKRKLFRAKRGRAGSNGGTFAQSCGLGAKLGYWDEKSETKKFGRRPDSFEQMTLFFLQKLVTFRTQNFLRYSIVTKFFSTFAHYSVLPPPPPLPRTGVLSKILKPSRRSFGRGVLKIFLSAGDFSLFKCFFFHISCCLFA